METISVPAGMEFWDSVHGMIRSVILPWGCEEQVCEQIGIAVEELFTNIVSYGYPEDKGTKAESAAVFQKEILVEAEVSKDPRRLVVRLIDWGIPFDPFEKADPDFEIPFDKRPIGGLGIYMVKRFMDQVKYERRGDCNITTIEKLL